MIIKGDRVYVDSMFIYIIQASKVVIYNKNSIKKMHTLNIKNPSIIVSDLSINFLVVCTTKSTIMVFSLNSFECEYETSLISEAFKVFYDDNSHSLYTSCVNLAQRKTELIKLDILNKEKTSTIVDELLILEPIEIKEEGLIIFCKLIDEQPTKKYYIRKYDKINLSLINSVEKLSILDNVYVLDSQLCYNYVDGIENIYTTGVHLYKDMGLNDKNYLLVKKIDDFYLLSRYKKAYVLSSDFKIIRVFNADDITKAITDLFIYDGYIYLIKGSKLYIDKLELVGVE